jgi:hypothetical protein
MAGLPLRHAARATSPKQGRSTLDLMGKVRNSKICKLENSGESFVGVTASPSVGAARLPPVRRMIDFKRRNK